MSCASTRVSPLRITTSRQSLIFRPGEQFTFDLQPLMEDLEPSTTIDIDTTLTGARRSDTLWSHAQRLPVPVEGPAIATLHVPLPREEGVYEIRVSVKRPPGFRQRFFPGGAAPLVERAFQVVVLADSPTFNQVRGKKVDVRKFPATQAPVVAVGFLGTQLLEANRIAMACGYI